MLKFQKPPTSIILADLLMLLLSFYVVLDWFPLTTPEPFEKYGKPMLLFTMAWMGVSYLFQRYTPLRKQKYFDVTLKLFYVCVVVFVLFALPIHFYFKDFSGFVLLSIIVGVFSVNYVGSSLYYAYRFAVEYKEIESAPILERVNAGVKPAVSLDEESYHQLCSTIRLYSGIKVLHFLEHTLDLSSGSNLVYISSDANNLKLHPNYQYATIVQLERLNDMRGLNAKLTVINEKLPDDGIFICCFESKSTRKKRILNQYLVGLNYLFYSLDYILKRIVPKIFIIRGIYYFITRGKNRIFSKTEVLGRLVCFGFKVINEKKIGKLTYVVAQRVKQPEPKKRRTYGPLIRLHRMGKDGVPFDVYKIRTMHPYSEYLQHHIFERNSLKAGGKFNKDIRITTLGGIMRRYWLDELPMLINLFRGEMKLVGVRPLSRQYYSLYTKELQEKRKKYKPGLLPPFYADMPNTLDEIQQSEMNYLLACEKSGVFLTDVRYFFRILKNILFKKARSA